MFFWTENLTCLDSLTPVDLVVVQLSLLTCNMIVISLGIPARPPKVTFAIESFSSLLESSHVKWYTDNQAAAKIVDVGSMKPDLHKLRLKYLEPA